MRFEHTTFIQREVETTLERIYAFTSQNLRMTSLVNIEQGVDLIRNLTKRNFIEKIPINELTKLCKAIHDIHVTIKKPQLNLEEEQKLYFPPSV